MYPASLILCLGTAMEEGISAEAKRDHEPAHPVSTRRPEWKLLVSKYRSGRELKLSLAAAYKPSESWIYFVLLQLVPTIRLLGIFVTPLN